LSRRPCRIIYWGKKIIGALHATPLLSLIPSGDYYNSTNSFGAKLVSIVQTAAVPFFIR